MPDILSNTFHATPFIIYFLHAINKFNHLTVLLTVQNYLLKGKSIKWFWGEGETKGIQKNVREKWKAFGYLV